MVAILSSALYVALLLVLAADPELAPTGLAATFPSLALILQIVGFGGLVAATALFYAAHRALGTHWTLAVELKEHHRLIERGPYRYIRHPLYTSFIGSELSALALVQSWLALLPLLLSIPGFWMMARAEERLLSERFAPAYAEYVARTGAFLPRLRPR